jgi:Ulp1 family protease
LPGIHDSESLFRILRRFLKAVWEHWKGADEKFAVEDIAECAVPVPQQPNKYDCGPFVLHSLDKFVKEAPEVFTMAELRSHKDSEVSALNFMDLMPSIIQTWIARAIDLSIFFVAIYSVARIGTLQGNCEN